MSSRISSDPLRLLVVNEPRREMFGAMQKEERRSGMEIVSKSWECIFHFQYKVAVKILT